MLISIVSTLPHEQGDTLDKQPSEDFTTHHETKFGALTMKQMIH